MSTSAMFGSLRSKLKAQISLFTHSDFLASGEQQTINTLDLERALSISGLKHPPLMSVSSRNILRRRCVLLFRGYDSRNLWMRRTGARLRLL